jgi:transcriptional regulator with XRE-family HTH domain
MIRKLHSVLLFMAFPERLQAIRKEKGLTQEGLANLVDLTKLQIYRYERGASQPTLDVLKRLAIALTVSIDELVFDEGERGPDEDLRLQFEAVARLLPEEKQMVKTLIESVIIRHDSLAWQTAKSE